MLKRPFQIWTLFGLCLALGLSAMIWLTFKALQVDQAEAQAQRQAELEEAIGSALWQMDAELTRLLVPEIARPPLTFQPFLGPPAAAATAQPSPLLRSPSPYVFLHFELRPGDKWSSPQCPTGLWCDLALQQGVSSAGIQLSGERLQRLAATIGYRELLAALPTQTLPEGWAMRHSTADQQGVPQGVNYLQNTLDYEAVQEQLADARQTMTAPPDESLSLNGSNLARQQRTEALRNQELTNRSAAFQSIGNQVFTDVRANSKFAPSVQQEKLFEGVSRPVWMNGQLLLARRVQMLDETAIQGAWLDWTRIKQQLLTRVEGLLPDADIQPVTDLTKVRLSRVLGMVPAELVVADPPLSAQSWSPIRVSLLMAWGSLLVATVAAAVLLRGVITLSERRAAFVSSVTHELRTPLTTFRMYTEMLAEGMVSGEPQRKVYLETLRREADRLSHLVDNVLQYARLERGSQIRRRETLTIEALIERILPRLVERVEQAEMEFEWEQELGAQEELITTDPAAVEQILFNLVDNACKYAGEAADRRIRLALELEPNELSLMVRDSGPGIPDGQVRRLFQPFSKSVQAGAESTPGVGLGLYLCRRLAGELGGRLRHCANREGTTFLLSLPR